ncbi:MAG TPA: NADH-quinone oxidoreductase subunit K [Acidimicrobiales bacterium]
MTLLLPFAAAALFGVGTYLVLQRQLSRIVIGIGLLGHGTNVLFVISARGRGEPPFVGSSDGGEMTDPLPEALALTAIVITFGVTAFLLALAYRSWIVTRHDEVDDDVEDRLIARRGLRPTPAEDGEADEPGEGEEDRGAGADGHAPLGSGAPAGTAEGR